MLISQGSEPGLDLRFLHNGEYILLCSGAFHWKTETMADFSKPEEFSLMVEGLVSWVQLVSPSVSRLWLDSTHVFPVKTLQQLNRSQSVAVPASCGLQVNILTWCRPTTGDLAPSLHALLCPPPWDFLLPLKYLCLGGPGGWILKSLLGQVETAGQILAPFCCYETGLYFMQLLGVWPLKSQS